MKIIDQTNDKIILQVSPEELAVFQKIATPSETAKDVLWKIRWEQTGNPKSLNLAIGYFLRSDQDGLDELSYEKFLAELRKPRSILLTSVRGLGKANLRVLREYFLNNG